jgi:hypothetical protein
MTTPRNQRWRPGTPPRSSDTVIAQLRRALDRVTATTAADSAAARTVIQQAAMNAVLTDDGPRPADLVAAACRQATDNNTPPLHRDVFSRLAYQVAQQAVGDRDPAALEAARVRATVLDDQGYHDEAANLWGRLIALYQLTHQPVRALQARIAHAVDLHRTGRCGEAVNQMSDAWDDVFTTYCDDGSAIPTMLPAYRAMLAACSLDDERRVLLALVAVRTGDPVSEPALAMVATAVPGAKEHRPVCAYRAHTRREDPR